MNNLQIFNDARFGEIRSMTQGEVILFVAADVCRALEIKNVRDAVGRLDEDEKGVVLTDTLGGKQNLNAVNEYGLYNLVLTSRKPEAKAFKRWITHEVIPSIRKTGSYSKPSKNPAKIEQQEQRAKAMLLNAQSRQCKLWLQLAEATDLPDYKHICQQKAAEALAGTNVLPMQEAARKTYSATEVGKQLGITAHKVGLLANKFALKSEAYGKYFYDKSPNSNKQVETFRYYQNAIEKLKELLEGGAAK